MENEYQLQRTSKRQTLATDLDGTWIPLAGVEQNQADLAMLTRQLAEHDVTLVYITGRHFASAQQAITQFGLPVPDWLICDVGTSMFRRSDAGRFVAVEQYQHHQDGIIATLPIEQLQGNLSSVPGLRLQESEKQGRFKLSYYVDAAELERLTSEVEELLRESAAPYAIIHSVDPFNGDGLIDLLPHQVSKAYALAWWVEHAGLHQDSIVFSGDSGNDYAAMTAGYRAIVVGNADRKLARRAYEHHRQAGWDNRLFLAGEAATSGVLAGCQWFGLVPSPAPGVEDRGATPATATATDFRVWAPRNDAVAVEVERDGVFLKHDLVGDAGDVFSGRVEDAGPGTRYRFALDNDVSRPDPFAHFQPDGVHGPSQVIDHQSFAWTDREWRGVAKRDLVIYELHIGAFTQEGTFRAAIERIPELLALGVTAVELMPVAQSPGRWNWGYDGVDLFAVRNTYGRPDDLKTFVDACHNAGLAVILDVVYNHLGPEGNYLADFGPYFSAQRQTPWGEAFHFDGDDSTEVRNYVIRNAIFWLEEYHFDGLRLDAVHFIYDDRDFTILDEIRSAVTCFEASVDRSIHLIAETNVYDDDLLSERPERPAYDAIWCDCLMHSMISHALPELRLTHRQYRGTPDVIDALRFGYVFEGPDQTRVTTRSERANSTERRRQIESFVVGLQTHDSVGNHPLGRRIHQLTSKEFQMAAAGLTLLYPGIPLLFMGEEHAIESPFAFFVDFEDPQLRRAVDEGRANEYPQHVWGDVISPSEPQVFAMANCHDAKRQDGNVFQWYRDLIALRKRGIAAGWLSVDRMDTEFDEKTSIFTLRFKRDAGGWLSVQARLADASQAATVAVPTNGHVLLSSLPGAIVEDGGVTLSRQQAVVIET